jgi:xanthine dehydrogenase FAD-binding subunit
MVSAYRPASLEEALGILSRGRATVLAGGTDLMVRYRRSTGCIPCFTLPVLFIGQLEELRAMHVEPGVIRIGAACTFSDLLRWNELPEELREVISGIASPAIRNRATVGGNVCNASPAADTLPYLYAVNAQAVLTGEGKSRLLPVSRLITGPGRTALGEKELLTEIRIPRTRFSTFFYRRVGARRANACSKLSFLGLARVGKGELREARICFGAVAPTVVRSPRTERRLSGLKAPEIGRMIPQIRAAYGRLIRPIDDQRCSAGYRMEISLRLLEYFLGMLADGCGDAG